MTLFILFYVIPTAILLALFFIGLFIRDDKTEGSMSALAIIVMPALNIVVLAFVLDSLITCAVRSRRSK